MFNLMRFPVFKKVLVIFVLMFNSITALAIDNIQFTVNSFAIDGDNPLGKQAYDVLAPYVGDHAGMDGLFEAKQALEDKLIAEGYTFYRVTLPAQTLEQGIVKLTVKSFKVTQAIVKGNKFFSEDNVRNSLPGLKPNAAPSLDDLSKQLTLANMNPAKSTSLSFKAGDQPQSLTAVLNVKDTNPQSFFVLLSNAGTQETALSRVSMGYQNNNVFDKDHSMTVTYTTSPEQLEDIRQFGLSYQMPLYEHGASLGFLISASSVESGSVADNIEVKGSGNVASMTYLRPLVRLNNYQHNINISINHKLYNNDITQAGVAIGSDVTSSPVKLAYDGKLVYPKYGFGLHIDYEANVSIGSNNDDSDYAAVRVGSTADWSTLHYALNFSQRFNNRSLFIARLNGQQSSDALISGEQFGVGGANSVRAYEERSLLGDTGNALSLEFVSQPFTDYKLKFIGFTDYAKVKLNNVQPGSLDYKEISSVGFGVRWNQLQKIAFKLDLGYALDDALLGTTSEIMKGDVKAHATLLYRF